MVAPYSLSRQSERCLFEPVDVKHTICRDDDDMRAKGRGCLDGYLPQWTWDSQALAEREWIVDLCAVGWKVTVMRSDESAGS